MILRLPSFRLLAALPAIAILPLGSCMSAALDWETPLLHPANPDAPTIRFERASGPLEEAHLRELVEPPIVRPAHERDQDHDYDMHDDHERGRDHSADEDAPPDHRRDHH